jgi:hypothetical protein
MRLLVIGIFFAGVAVLLVTCSGPPPLELVFTQFGKQVEFINMAQTATNVYRLWVIQARSRVSEPLRLRVRIEEPAPEGMGAQLTGETDLLPQGEGRIKLALSPPAALGPFQGALTIYAEGDPEIAVRFRFGGEVVPARYAEPFIRIEQLPDQPLSFGKVAPGTTKRFAFRVRNEGEEPLVIARWEVEPRHSVRLEGVRGGDTVAPRSALDVRGAARAPGKPGAFRYRILIHSNAKNSPVQQVALPGEVVVPYHLEPGSVRDPRAVRFRHPEYATVVVAGEEAQPFTIGRIHGGEDLFEVVSRGSAEPARRQEVRLRLRRDARLGRHETKVTIRIDPAGVELEWAFHVNVVATVVADPPVVHFGRTRAGVQREVRLVSTVDREFKVKEVQTEHGIVLAVARTAAGLAPTLVVTVRPGAPRGSFRDVITIETDDPRTPRLRIAVHGTLR